ncbi:hypothetical protein GLOTRDRAFT_133984 [Gloeophyllum trabeum ATCC 11539]|uniref:Uncharacterized protein n=1 Tax=Gloeophyllum trabeum (strain ATCC 11539 / FP-39264 / Madison 617) TaxID=670483 RepID=S7PSS7_GLOTA|nr:uncharacterized protein GLOTRDRAFT_133984 [Gloeophyllum trabeum ATCC 11539]EPQ50432.1 hypothetical protein GLOTRDRAFT_133984 [Gloeophyllum trabeum ATCC 11539]
MASTSSRTPTDDELRHKQFLNSEWEREEAFEETLRSQRYEVLQAEISNGAGERARNKVFDEFIVKIDEARANAAYARMQAFEGARESQQLEYEKNEAIRSAAFQSEMHTFQAQVVVELEVQEKHCSRFMDFRGPVLAQDHQHRQAVCASLRRRFEQQFDDILKPWVEAFDQNFEALLRKRQERALRLRREYPQPFDELFPGAESSTTHTVGSVPGYPDADPTWTSGFEEDLSGSDSTEISPLIPLPHGSHSLRRDTIGMPSSSSNIQYLGGANQSEEDPGNLSGPVEGSRPGGAMPPLACEEMGASPSREGSNSNPARNEDASPKGMQPTELSIDVMFQENQTNRRERFREEERERVERWIAEEMVRDYAGTDREVVFESKILDSAKTFTQEMLTYDRIFEIKQQDRVLDVTGDRFNEALSQWVGSFRAFESQTDSLYVSMMKAEEDLVQALQDTVEEVVERQTDWMNDLRDKHRKVFSQTRSLLAMWVGCSISLPWNSKGQSTRRKFMYRTANRESEMVRDIDRVGTGPAPKRPCPLRQGGGPIRLPSFNIARRPSSPVTGVGIQSIVARTYIADPLPIPGDLHGREANLSGERDRQTVFRESQESMKTVFDKSMRKRQQEFALKEAGREQAFAQAQTAWQRRWQAQERSQSDEYIDSQRRRAEEFQESQVVRKRKFHEEQRDRAKRFHDFIEARRDEFRRNQEAREVRWTQGEDNLRYGFWEWEEEYLAQLSGMVTKYQGLFCDDEASRHQDFERAVDSRVPYSDRPGSGCSIA